MPAVNYRPMRQGELRRTDVAARLAGKKLTKEEANYRVGKDAISGKSCFECEFYENKGQDTSSCRRVAGPVEARDLCDLFTQRMSNSSNQSGRNAAIEVKIRL